MYEEMTGRDGSVRHTRAHARAHTHLCGSDCSGGKVAGEYVQRGIELEKAERGVPRPTAHLKHCSAAALRLRTGNLLGGG